MDERVDQQQYLQTFLHDRTWPCPSCGYDLRNLTSQACPECGQALALQVNLAEPKLAAFIVGLVGLAASAGFSGLFLLLGVVMSVIQPLGGPPIEFWWITGGGTLASGLALFVWVRIRRCLSRQEAGRRWRLGVACWGLPALNFIALLWSAASP